jgi:hypothetical protein
MVGRTAFDRPAALLIAVVPVVVCDRQQVDDTFCYRFKAFPEIGEELGHLPDPRALEAR